MQNPICLLGQVSEDFNMSSNIFKLRMEWLLLLCIVKACPVLEKVELFVFLCVAYLTVFIRVKTLVWNAL